MNCLSWNCRGARGRRFPSLMNDVIREYNVGLLCLMETHISGDCAWKVARKISLDKCFMVQAQGQAGGIWFMWDSNRWFVDILEHTAHLIHIKINEGDNLWFCTFVYASPHPQGRIPLWRDISRLASFVDGAWLVMGDFNAILHPYERVGSISQTFFRGVQAFRSCINQTSLMDMGYNGAPFTWRRGNLFERLDRALVSYEWCVRFPDASLSHLNPLKSDHTPILVRFSTNMSAIPIVDPFALRLHG
ncbi:uncharacterized protein LOC109816188 [Cajanus cajan]|uniref:Endonuclease/exonuclease/phosphatase domain-containing protein n=1 Tax=Cajanus cajan TaxID=3821 RepID=A0A151RSH5_CAJCA|nr:uncharacterized protein LOC109816188 [Cajanus cajan]KYP45494.1 hypothetical protein KK1_032968 [Cajanus cajan]